ncbi:MAG TPA: type IV pili twitching motility protein PilT, partial [Gemmatimonadales bacterium]|nr:type IV pili twitching motility protein PilT [Gemmatimonadales bacterium]
MLDLKDLLQIVSDQGASDLHLIVGASPTIRVDGQLIRLDAPPLKSSDTAAIALAITPPDRQHLLETQKEVDFAHSIPGGGRFRVNVFRQRGSMSVVMRRVRLGGASFKEL